MSIEYPNLKRIVAATAAIVMFSLPLAAQTADLTDESALLGALAQADAATAPGIERQLQAVWDKSGSAALDLLLDRGREALESGDSLAAIEHLTALTDHAPDFAEAWFMRASAYFEAGLFGPALADLERALYLNPNNYNAIIGQGAMFETFGDPDRAWQTYQRAQAIHPNHEELGKVLERLKPEIEGKAL